jgi:hypothetical protein
MLDAVIFEDLVVAGPDRSGTRAALVAQRQAAQEIARDTLALLDAGLDPATLLNHYSHGSRKTGNGPPDHLTAWKERYSHSILQRPTRSAQRARALELLRFPDLGNLRRTQ